VVDVAFQAQGSEGLRVSSTKSFHFFRVIGVGSGEKHLVEFSADRSAFREQLTDALIEIWRQSPPRSTIAYLRMWGPSERWLRLQNPESGNCAAITGPGTFRQCKESYDWLVTCYEHDERIFRAIGDLVGLL